MRLGDAGPDDLAWLEARAGCVLTRNAVGIRAVDSRGLTRGVVAYDNWTPNSFETHFALDAPSAWRCLMHATFEYPFLKAGRQLMLATIPECNVRSLRMVRHLGLTELARVPEGWAPGVDLLVMLLRRCDCQWIREEVENGQGRRQAAAA